MSGTVRGEIWLLGGSVYGIALMMMYDGLRIFRWLVRHSSFWTGMEGCGVLALCQLCDVPAFVRSRMTGVLRGYAVAGVLGGMVFYDRTGSRLLFAVLKKCSRWIKIKGRGKKARRPERNIQQGDRQRNLERK